MKLRYLLLFFPLLACANGLPEKKLTDIQRTYTKLALFELQATQQREALLAEAKKQYEELAAVCKASDKILTGDAVTPFTCVDKPKEEKK